MGSADEEALGALASEAPEALELLRSLDSFCGNGQPEGVREADALHRRLRDAAIDTGGMGMGGGAAPAVIPMGPADTSGQDQGGGTAMGTSSPIPIAASAPAASVGLPPMDSAASITTAAVHAGTGQRT